MGQGRYDWTSSDEGLGAPKNSALMAQERGNKDDRKGKATIIDGAGSMEAGAQIGTRTKGEKEGDDFRPPR